MHFHILQHVDFEGPAAIAGWIEKNNHTLTTTKFFQGDTLPAQTYFDVLVVMGGPMGVEDVEHYPWLSEERQFIQQSINTGKTILGICLGAQLIARACGAAVDKNRHKEIGWFDVNINQEPLPSLLRGVFSPLGNEVFHWHGDTFDIPAGAQHVASSEACENQAFVLDNRIIGLQFHLEITETSAALLVENCRDELDGTRYVQSGPEIVADSVRISRINSKLFRLLENIVLAQN